LVTILAIVIVSYLIGSFPTGIVFGKAFKGVDVRTVGSKTIGATNVFRILGPKIAIPVLIVDILKGIIATILISKIYFGDIVVALYWLKIIAGFSAIIGHIFPVWIGFKGGKGVATATGVIFGLMPLEAGFACLLFVIVVVLTRYVSLGSILASLFIFCALLAEKLYLGISIPRAYMILSLVLLFIVLITHRHNIKRLLKGQENKFGEKAHDN
jgi:glycerol-3-phosphate acyltransferase PlsY